MSPPPPSGPRYLPYEPGMQIPEGYRVRRQRMVGLMISGGVTFATSYLYAFGSGASNEFKNGETWLVLPVFGPFAALAARDLDQCDINVGSVPNLPVTEAQAEKCFRDALKEAVRLAVITADGVLQVVGASLLVGGVIGGEKRLERIKPRVSMGPRQFGPRGYGIGVRGTF